MKCHLWILWGSGMARNTYFSQGSTTEAGLYEDIIIEAIKIYGQDVFYIPRIIVQEDNIFQETVESKFEKSFKMEMYLENTDGFEGQGDILSKFGIENRDEATLIVAKKTWNKALYGETITEPIRPKEGDLIYFTLSKGLFEIRFVEEEQPFYQLKNLPVYRLTVEAFEYSDEALDTGIDEIDVVETEVGSRVAVTMTGGSGTYQIGEVVTAADSTAAEVAEWDSAARKLQLVGLTDNFAVGDTLTGGSSGAAYVIETIDGIEGISSNDEFADNDIFETLGNNFVDFSEINPFGEI